MGLFEGQAAADNFMPLMAAVVIRARPPQLLAKLQLVSNHLDAGTMWFTHFVACVDYCCRLSPDGGQLDTSV